MTFFGVLYFVEAALSHLCFVLEAGQLLVSVSRVEKKPRHLRTRLKSHPLYRFGKKFDPTLPHKEVQQHPTTEQMVHRLVQAAERDEEGLIVNVASRYAHISTYTCKRLQISYQHVIVHCQFNHLIICITFSFCSCCFISPPNANENQFI